MKEKQLKWVLVLPALALIIALIIFPLIYALRASLYLFRYGKAVEFIGLKNFVDLFRNPLAWNAVLNTIIYVAIAVAAEFLLGLALALLTNREIRGFSRPVRAALTIPMFVAPVVVGIIWRMIYNAQYGLFNWVLGTRNFAPTGGNHALFFVILTDIWQWTPFMFIVLLAALEGQSVELLEAARVDGANRWQAFWHITFPQILPVSTTLFLIRMIEAFKIVDLPYVLTNGGPGTATESMTLQAYISWRSLDLGGSAAIAYLLLFLVTFLGTAFVSLIRSRLAEV